MPTDAPTFDMTAWECAGDLMIDLIQKKLLPPFWLTHDGSAMKVTEDRLDGFIDGLRIANVYDIHRTEA